MHISARFADKSLALAIALIPFQHVPALPIHGMIAADIAIAVACLLVALSSPPAPPTSLLASGAAFAAAATASALVNGGSYVKLLGHWELVALALASCSVARRNPLLLQRALVAAAVIAAASAVVGAALWTAGLETSLLNPTHGDLADGFYPRVRGVTERANQLASLIATSAIVLFACPRLVLSPRRRRVVWTVCACAAILTFSRTIPFGALALAAIATTHTPSPRRWLALGVAAAIGLALLWISVRYQVTYDPTAPWRAAIDWSTPGTRWVHIGDAIATARAHPWFGLGPGRTPAGLWSAHLTWLNLWSVLGLPAVVAIAALFAYALAGARAAPGPWWALLLLVCDSLHRDIEDMRHLWVVLGLCFAVARWQQSVQQSDGELGGGEDVSPRESG